MEPLLQERYWHAAVTLQGQVYVIGGRGSSTGSTTEVLPAGSNTWEEGPEIPVQMGTGPCAVAISATSFLVFNKKEIREFDASTAGPTSNQGWSEEAKWPKLGTSRKNWPGCSNLEMTKLSSQEEEVVVFIRRLRSWISQPGESRQEGTWRHQEATST